MSDQIKYTRVLQDAYNGAEYLLDAYVDKYGDELMLEMMDALEPIDDNTVEATIVETEDRRDDEGSGVDSPPQGETEGISDPAGVEEE